MENQSQLNSLNITRSEQLIELCYDHLKNQPGASNSCYWWLENRLLRVDVDINVSDDLRTENSAEPCEESSATCDKNAAITPYPCSSRASIKSHVAYMWHKLFTYPDAPVSLNLRLLGTQQNILVNEKQQWIHEAIEQHSSPTMTMTTAELGCTCDALDFVITQLTTCLDFYEKMPSVVNHSISSTSVYFDSSTGHIVPAFESNLHWLDPVPCYCCSIDQKSQIVDMSSYRIFYSILAGLSKSELKSYGLSLDMMNYKGIVEKLEVPSGETENRIDFIADFDRLMNSLCQLGLESVNIQCIKETLFAILHLSQVYCDNKDGKLRLHNEKNLSMASNLLQVDQAALQSGIILNVKYNGNHQFIEGYSTPEEATLHRNQLMILLYTKLVQYIMKISFHCDGYSGDSTKSVNILVPPTFLGKMTFLNSSMAIESSNLLNGYSQFVLNFCSDFLTESYAEFTNNFMHSDQQYPTLALVESTKKSESFIEKLIAGISKKSTLKTIHEWLRKYSKNSSKVFVAKKQIEYFGLMHPNNPEVFIHFSIPDVCNKIGFKVSRETIDLVKTSKNPVFNVVVNKSEDLTCFESLLNILRETRGHLSLQTHFIIALSTTSMQHQFHSCGINSILGRTMPTEMLTHRTFLKRYACVALHIFPEFPAIDPNNTNFVLQRLRLSDYRLDQNYVILTTYNVQQLENRLTHYHRNVLLLQAYIRRWQAVKVFRLLSAKAAKYKQIVCEQWLEMATKLTEFQEFAKLTYLHDLERHDTQLLHALFEKTSSKMPQKSEFWASVVIMERAEPVYVVILQNDVTLINGASEVVAEGHVTLAKIRSKLKSEEAQQALDSFNPGLLLTFTPNKNVVVEVKNSSDTNNKPVTIWGHWMNFGRNFVGGLRASNGELTSRNPTTLFDADEFRNIIAEGIITEEIDLDMLQLECLLPIVVSGHSSSLHDSPLWILVINYEPLEALKTSEMQREVRLRVDTLLAAKGDAVKTSSTSVPTLPEPSSDISSNADITVKASTIGATRVWSKSGGQRNLYSKDTDLKSQLLLIQQRREDGSAGNENRKQILKTLDSTQSRQPKDKLGQKVWSKQVFQQKHFGLKK